MQIIRRSNNVRLWHEVVVQQDLYLESIYHETLGNRVPSIAN